MTILKTDLLVGPSDLCHLGDDQDTQVTKISRPKKGDLWDGQCFRFRKTRLGYLTV